MHKYSVIWSCPPPLPTPISLTTIHIPFLTSCHLSLNKKIITYWISVSNMEHKQTTRGHNPKENWLSLPRWPSARTLWASPTSMTWFWLAWSCTGNHNCGTLWKNGPVMSRRHYFSVVLPNFWFIKSFCVFFHHAPILYKRMLWSE